MDRRLMSCEIGFFGRDELPLVRSYHRNLLPRLAPSDLDVIN
jgi:hypothetical protein